MISTIQRDDLNAVGRAFMVDGTVMIPVLPQPFVFPNLGEVGGVDYSRWWWQSVGDLLICAHSIMTLQGFKQNSKGVINFAPDTFYPRPGSRFVFLVKKTILSVPENDDMMEMNIGSIEDCDFELPLLTEVFVSHGWGSAVLYMIREYGVVSIKDPSSLKPPSVGIRWNGEEVDLTNLKLGWYK